MKDLYRYIIEKFQITKDSKIEKYDYEKYCKGELVEFDVKSVFKEFYNINISDNDIAELNKMFKYVYFPYYLNPDVWKINFTIFCEEHRKIAQIVNNCLVSRYLTIQGIDIFGYYSKEDKLNVILFEGHDSTRSNFISVCYLYENA